MNYNPVQNNSYRFLHNHLIKKAKISSIILLPLEWQINCTTLISKEQIIFKNDSLSQNFYSKILEPLIQINKLRVPCNSALFRSDIPNITCQIFSEGLKASMPKFQNRYL